MKWIKGAARKCVILRNQNAVHGAFATHFEGHSHELWSGPATFPLFGGCACGSIRYRLDAEPSETGYFHCRICQKISAALAVP
ncbi:GFA family protein [Azotobacter bryophylli]